MNETLTVTLAIAAILVPLLNALAFGLPILRYFAWRVSALAALPALLLALIADEGILLALPLVPFQLGLDQTGRIFLGFTAVLWLLSGWYAVRCLARETHRARFDIFFLL